MLFGAFQPLKPTPGGPATIFPWGDGLRRHSHSHRWGKQLKGWRREKKLNLIGTINPEFNDLAQTWGWKMITVHEKMYP
jgi:hypothetical protein